MYLFFDTETTGLPTRYNARPSDVRAWPRMVQLAWVLADEQGNELAAHCHTIRPDGFAIPADAVRVHGITTEIARLHGIDVRQALEELEADLPKAQLLIAHNIEFDNGVVGAEFFRAGRAANPLDGLQHFCTMRTTADLCRIPGGYSGYKWPRLEELHQTLFHQGLKAGHQALADARACARCYFELLKRASAGNEAPVPDEEEDDQEDVEELFDEIDGLAEDRDWFDPEFVESVREQYEERGFVTDGQREALERIRDMLERTLRP